MGILLWEEVPVYWTISWENPETYKNAENQLTELITRDKNRASVIIWSMANETPISEPRNKFLRSMIKHARSLDPSRLVSAALEKHSKEGEPNTMVIGDPIVEDVDILGFNQYIRWYCGTPESCDDVKWELNYNKPAIITEFGGGALQGLHGASNEVWTEEYQENLYKHTLDMLKRIPQFRGVTPWILTDFRSPRRHLPVVQDGWNRKGLMSEKGEKKKAYYVLQNLYIDIINNGFKFK
jgi:beta-glucuronidase